MIKVHAVQFLFLPLLMAGALAQPVSALEIRQAPGTVVELFTSQGCSSCPEADVLLSALSERDDVIALAYHVDYWDYIGWEDTFGSPEHSQLQQAYAESWGKNRVYTPQMVINGSEAVVGPDAGAAEDAIAGASAPLEMTLSGEGESAVRLVAAPNSELGSAVVWVVTFRDAAEVVIERGENSGQVLPYSHIVTSRQAIGMWHPDTGAEITIPLDELMGSHSDGMAIIVQEKNGALPGPILSAAAVHR